MPTSNSREISLNEVAKLANMPESYFSRFIKRHTGRTFVDTLNEIRLGYATRMLIETTHTIAEIAYSSGFDNVTYFNRIFKKKEELHTESVSGQLFRNQDIHIVALQLQCNA